MKGTEVFPQRIGKGVVVGKGQDFAGTIDPPGVRVRQFGRRAGWVKVGGFFLIGFTLIPRLFRGRSPGKWLFGLRVVRTDGGRFTWSMSICARRSPYRSRGARRAPSPGRASPPGRRVSIWPA